MNNSTCKIKKSGAGLLIFLCWLIYTTSYLGKLNYSANITQIIDFYKISKAEAGIAPTFFFFAYGVGQAVNGFFCKKYNTRWMIFISLFTSAILNLMIATTTSFLLIKWLWLVNGFVLSILWPTLVRLLAESLPQKDLGKSSLIMGTTVAFGTLIIYGLSSIYAAFDQFKLAFYTAAFAGIVVSVFWMILYKPAVRMAKSEKTDNEGEKEAKQDIQKEPMRNTEKRTFYTTIYLLCFCAIGVNLIKDGLTTWVPSILKEGYSITDSISILLTLLLPIVAIFGNLFALEVYKKIPNYITHCVLVFAIILGFLGVIIGSIAFKQVAFMLVGLIVVYFLASSLNSLITSIFPMFMRETVNSGLYAGVLNAFCYIGSTISSYGLGAIADNFGWSGVFWTLMGFCVIVCVVLGGYLSIKHFVKEKKDKSITLV